MSNFVAVDHVIDLDVVPDPGALSHITFFCSKIRTAAGVSLPPVSMQGDKIVGDFDALDKFLAQDQGSTVADPIEAPVVSESSELRSPRTTKGKRWSQIEQKPAG